MRRCHCGRLLPLLSGCLFVIILLKATILYILVFCSFIHSRECRDQALRVSHDKRTCAVPVFYIRTITAFMIIVAVFVHRLLINFTLGCALVAGNNVLIDAFVELWNDMEPVQ